MTDYSSTISFCKALNRTEGENSLKNVFLKEMTSSYNEAHENMITRFDVLVNGTDGKDIYVNFSDTPIRGVIDVRKKQGATTIKEETIQVYPNNIKQGDIIQFKYNDNDTLHYYLVMSQINKKCHYDEGVFVQCNQFLNWKGCRAIIPCYVTSNSYGSKGELHNYSQMGDFDSRCVITVQRNEETEKIYEGMRFCLGSQWDIFEVTKKLGAYSPNMWQLICKYTKALSEDDIDNRICYNRLLEEKFDPSDVDYRIIGEDLIEKNNSTIYTLKPSTNGVVWSLDDDSILNNLATIVTQSDNSCEIQMLSSNKLVQLVARDNEGNLLAYKDIYGIE